MQDRDENDLGNLCLSRRVGEKIVIGDDIVIEIVDVRGDNVRIGITAPKDVPIHRDDVIKEMPAQTPKPH